MSGTSEDERWDKPKMREKERICKEGKQEKPLIKTN